VSLRQGLRDSNLFSDVIVVKNKTSGVMRYLQVIGQLLKVRFTKNPDVYLLTFRGYEMLPFVLLIGIGKKIVYDEFINPVEWFVYEHKKFKESSISARLLQSAFRWMMMRATAIVADTQSHADYSSQLMNVPKEKYFSIPVGTDETTFKPLGEHTVASAHNPFTVLYIGSMLPLHGVQYVINAAIAMAANPNITFHLVGGKSDVADMIKSAQAKGAHIRYEAWVDYKELPQLFLDSDLCLGGPFGDTVQSQYVVTGKTYQFLASARPVVVGDNQETRLFKDKDNALVVAQGSAQALQDAIEWAAGHPEKLRAIGRNGRKLYEQQFSSARIADDLRRLFASKHIL
jgi:glycosyltransferase involved in cell wall biosynthesis